MNLTAMPAAQRAIDSGFHATARGMAAYFSPPLAGVSHSRAAQPCAPDVPTKPGTPNAALDKSSCGSPLVGDASQTVTAAAPLRSADRLSSAECQHQSSVTASGQCPPHEPFPGAGIRRGVEAGTTPGCVGHPGDSPDDWRPIEGYAGLYLVSRCGRAWRSQRKATGVHGSLRTLAPGEVTFFTQKNGYRHAVLTSATGIRTNHLLHRLVADAFCPRRSGCDHVNHKDCDKTNNAASNLEWVTFQENIDHAVANGRIGRGAPVTAGDDDDFEPRSWKAMKYAPAINK